MCAVIWFALVSWQWNIIAHLILSWTCKILQSNRTYCTVWSPSQNPTYAVHVYLSKPDRSTVKISKCNIKKGGGNQPCVHVSWTTPCFSPVPGVDEFRPQAEPLQRFIADDDEDGGWQGGDNASGESLGQAPHALLSHELLKCFNHWWTAFHLVEGKGLFFFKKPTMCHGYKKYSHPC